MSMRTVICFLAVSLFAISCGVENDSKATIEAYYKCKMKEDSVCAVQYFTDEWIQKLGGPARAAKIEAQKMNEYKITYEIKSKVETDNSADVVVYEKRLSKEIGSASEGPTNYHLVKINGKWKIRDYD